MAVNFYRQRLHVGHRLKDWSDVWMELRVDVEDSDSEVKQNADGEYDFDLYQFKTGGKEPREPMVGEVVWHTHFDPSRCESSKKNEREKMQKQFLSDAYHYLAARDRKLIKRLEHELHQPAFRRWQSWFEIAKKYKRRHIRNLAHGLDDDDDDDDQDDDSAYDSADEDQIGNMPPPRTPASMNKRGPNGNGGQSQNAKRSKVNHRFQSNLDSRGRETPIIMSGGLGSRRTPSRNTSQSVDASSDNESATFDTTEPVDLREAIQANSRSQIGSPVGSRHRGNSRESFLSFRQSGRNGGSREVSPAEEDNPGPDENEMRRRDINGDFSEDEAFRFARRASMDPGL